MIERITGAMASIKGEAMRKTIRVRAQGVTRGHWGIGGKALVTADVKALAAEQSQRRRQSHH